MHLSLQSQPNPWSIPLGKVDGGESWVASRSTKGWASAFVEMRSKFMPCIYMKHMQ